MPSTIEFSFSDDEALPTIPIVLSHAGFSVSKERARTSVPQDG
ncbi:hypothetical protein [Scytonema sp. UIC 10036]|nr:hypothetical protein [Scytonema sp. UIC 10036]